MKKQVVLGMVLGSVCAIALALYGSAYYAQSQVTTIHRLQKDFEQAVQDQRIAQASALLQELHQEQQDLHNSTVSTLYLEFSPPENLWGLRKIEGYQADAEKVEQLKLENILVSLSEYELQQIQHAEPIAHAFADTELFNDYVLKRLSDYAKTHHDEILTRRVQADSQIYASIQKSSVVPTPTPSSSTKETKSSADTEYAAVFQKKIEEAESAQDYQTLIQAQLDLSQAHLQHGALQEAVQSLNQASARLSKNAAHFTPQGLSAFQGQITRLKQDLVRAEPTEEAADSPPPQPSKTPTSEANSD